MENYTHFYINEWYTYKEFLEECKYKIYTDTVTHLHHIIPKHLGGSDEKDNLIKLSIEDHIDAHLKLSKVFPEGSVENIRNLQACRLLNRVKHLSLEDMKAISESYKGKANPFYGKSLSKEHKELLASFARLRKGKTYDELYEDAEGEKSKRRKSVKKSWNEMTNEQREIRKQNITEALSKIKLVAPNRKPIEINGVTYESVTEAGKCLNMSTYKVLKLKEKENERIT